MICSIAQRADFGCQSLKEAIQSAGWVKKITSVPTITVGSVTTNQEFGSKEKSAEDGITFHDLEKRLERKESDPAVAWLRVNQ